MSAFFSRTDTPETDANQAGPRGSDYSGRAFYDFRNQVWQVAGGYTQVGDNFNPEVGFLPRRGYRRPEFRVFFQPQPKNIKWIRRFAPHISSNAYWDLNGRLQTAFTHLHPFEIQPMRGGRFGWLVDQNKDNPLTPFVVFNRDGNRVVIPPGDYTWWQHGFEYFHDPSAAVTGTIRYRIGNYYDGDFNAIELTSDYRFTARFTASVGWTRQEVDLPYGSFVTNLIPVKASYSFTNLASLSALVQYNGQTGVYSSNIRLALLNRSGTGLFVVYNDRRDVLDTTSVRHRGTIVRRQVHAADRFLRHEGHEGHRKITKRAFVSFVPPSCSSCYVISLKNGIAFSSSAAPISATAPSANQ